MQLTNPVLLLRVARFNDEPVAEPMAVEFGPAGGTIGRATDCTLVLPDQQRAISRVQARVECRGGEYLLCDVGANPSVLNEREIGGTREARLATGDRLVIGPYLLEVAVQERAAGEQPGFHDPLASAKVLSGPLPEGGALGFGAIDPLGQRGFGAQPGAGFRGSQSDHVSPEFEAFATPVPAAVQPGLAGGHGGMHAGGGIPADYDPLADALAQWDAHAEQAIRQGAAPMSVSPAAPVMPVTPVAPKAPVSPMPSISPPLTPSTPHDGPTGLPASLLDGPLPGGATPFDDLFGGASPSSHAGVQPMPLPALAPLAPLAPHETPLELPMPAHAPIAVQPQQQVESLSERLSQPVPERQPVPQPEPQSRPAQQSILPTEAFIAPQSAAPSVPAVDSFAAAQPVAPAAESFAAAQPAAPSTPAAGAPAAPLSPASAASAARPASPAAYADPTLAALIIGLGLDPSRAPNLPAPEFAHLIGTMLREALRGTMAVLRSRTTTKREARLDTTVIVARDNNPLKFFPDVDSALAQMLTGRSAGYLPPDQALEHAFIDIQSHELAVIAGMRAALAHVLGRFDPSALDIELKEQGVVDKLLSNRKAKLWDRFVEMQAQITRDSEDDFQRLFGNAFNEAYEAQIDALYAARNSKPGGNS